MNFNNDPYYGYLSNPYGLMGEVSGTPVYTNPGSVEDAKQSGKAFMILDPSGGNYNLWEKDDKGEWQKTYIQPMPDRGGGGLMGWVGQLGQGISDIPVVGNITDAIDKFAYQTEPTHQLLKATTNKTEQELKDYSHLAGLIAATVGAGSAAAGGAGSAGAGAGEMATYGMGGSGLSGTGAMGAGTAAGTAGAATYGTGGYDAAMAANAYSAMQPGAYSVGTGLMTPAVGTAAIGTSGMGGGAGAGAGEVATYGMGGSGIANAPLSGTGLAGGGLTTSQILKATKAAAALKALTGGGGKAIGTGTGTGTGADTSIYNQQQIIPQFALADNSINKQKTWQQIMAENRARQQGYYRYY